jgi:hypothetical protein
VFKEEFVMVKGMLMSRDEEAARAFALEIDELNQVEITESGPIIKNKKNQNKASAFHGYQGTPKEKEEVRRRYDLLIPLKKPTLHPALNCHLCGVTKNKVAEGVQFGDCGHAFCNSHCIQKYGVNCRDIKACSINLKCPVCTLQCNCKACEKNLDKLCYDMLKHRSSSKQNQALYEIEWTPPSPTKARENDLKRKKTTTKERSITTKERSNSGSAGKTRKRVRCDRDAPESTRKSGRAKKDTDFNALENGTDYDIMGAFSSGPVTPKASTGISGIKVRIGWR